MLALVLRNPTAIFRDCSYCAWVSRAPMGMHLWRSSHLGAYVIWFPWCSIGTTIPCFPCCWDCWLGAVTLTGGWSPGWDLLASWFLASWVMWGGPLKWLSGILLSFWCWKKYVSRVSSPAPALPASLFLSWKDLPTVSLFVRCSSNSSCKPFLSPTLNFSMKNCLLVIPLAVGSIRLCFYFFTSRVVFIKPHFLWLSLCKFVGIWCCGFPDVSWNLLKNSQVMERV